MHIRGNATVVNAAHTLEHLKKAQAELLLCFYMAAQPKRHLVANDDIRKC